MKEINKYAINDDELDTISGGNWQHSEPWWQNYRINGFTYGEAAEYINEFKRLQTVDNAIRFANNRIFRNSGWKWLRTEDALTVFRSMFEIYYNSKKS